MKFSLVVLVSSTLLVLNGCDLFKKGGKNEMANVVNLDTVETVATPAAPPVYQASATRLSDIIHTKLDVSFDWAKQYMYGKATITAKPYFYPNSSLVLDARGMEIKEVDLVTPGGKQPLKYRYENDELNISLNKEYKSNEEYTVYIDYISKPNELKKKGGSAAITDDKGLYFINPLGTEKNKPQEIWTQGETQSSSVWYPTIDRPNERMSQEIYMTVDKKYVTLSNGELCSSFDNGDGTRTDYWKQELPIAPYLSMMAVGDFAVVKDNKWRGKEVNYYVEKEFEPYAKGIFGNTPEMLEFYSNKLGVEYVWNKYSQIIVRDYVSGAMENVSATLHGEFLNQTDRERLDEDHEDVIAHELFHQWFGDLVTCESWSNIPLNESFATYGEYLWIEHKYGIDEADMHSAESRMGYLSEAERKQVPLIRFNYDDKEDMFDAHSYNKGGQVLNMLRHYVGDDAFFASLKLYLETNKFSSVEIHNLRLAFEQVTGEDLNWFFNQWFLSAGHPDLVIATSYDATRQKAVVSIKQVQDASKYPVFKLPIYIDIYSEGNKKDRQKVVVTKADETFEFDAAQKPLLINVDAEKSLLCAKNEQKSLAEWAYQFQHAPLFLDRYEALENFQKMSSDSLAKQMIISALSDKYWYIRYEAEGMLKDVIVGNEKQVKEKLVDLAKNDPKATVRSSAISILIDNFGKDDDLQPLYHQGLNDQSYSVLGNSLMGISKAHPEEGMKLAANYENEKSTDVLYSICELYANYGGDDKNDFYLKSADKFTSYAKIGFITQYGNFLRKGKKDATIEAGLPVLAGIANEEGTSKWITYYAKKSIKDLYTMYGDRIDFDTQKLNTQKAANPNGSTVELEQQIENDKAMQKKVQEVFNSLK